MGVGGLTVYELLEEHNGLAPGIEVVLVRRHLHSPFITVAPVDQPFRGLPIPTWKLREVG